MPFAAYPISSRFSTLAASVWLTVDFDRIDTLAGIFDDRIECRAHFVGVVAGSAVHYVVAATHPVDVSLSPMPKMVLASSVPTIWLRRSLPVPLITPYSSTGSSTFAGSG